MSASELLLLVRPDLPRSRLELRDFRERHNREGELLDGLAYLCLAVSDAHGNHSAQIEALRTYIEILWQGTHQLDLFLSPYQAVLHDPDPTGLYKDINERAAVADNALRAFVKGYMPPRLVSRLFPAQEEYCPDILTLILRGFCPQSSEHQKLSVFERQAGFEAQRTAILALVSHEQIRRWRRIGYKRSRQDFREIADELHSQQIIGIGDAAYKRGPLRSWHNPADEYRTVWIEGISGKDPGHTAGLVKRQTHLSHTLLHHPDGPFPVIVAIRRKRMLQTLGKLRTLRVPTPDSIGAVADRRGLCFAYRNLEELHKGSEWLRQVFPVNPLLGSHWEEYKDSTDKPVNPYSAENFVSISYFRMILGRRCHIQHRLALQHLDLIYSRGDENHTLYHLRQYRAPGGLFPWLFPYELYGVDWGLASTVAEMKNYVLASLP